MQNQNTRRGNTQKSNNAVVYKNGHSRGILSGIYHACRCKNKENTLLNRYVEDPRQHSSGMTPSFDNGLTAWGFTLIELLVVVLIIGILAAVALPQYNKAVKRAQGREVIVAINTLDKVLAAYALEHGGLCDYSGWGDYCNIHDLDIDIPDTKHFQRTGTITPTHASDPAPFQTFTSNAGDAKVNVTWDLTTGRRTSAICGGADCPAYFGGECTTKVVKLVNGRPISDADASHYPPSYISERNYTSCELDI